MTPERIAILFGIAQYVLFGACIGGYALGVLRVKAPRESKLSHLLTAVWVGALWPLSLIFAACIWRGDRGK